MAVEERDCVDLHGRLISPGNHFVHGSPHHTAFMICMCSDDGLPTSCKTAFSDCKTNEYFENPPCAEDDHTHREAAETNDLMKPQLLHAIAIIILTSLTLYIFVHMKRRQLRTQSVDQRLLLTRVQLVTPAPRPMPRPRPSPREMLEELFRIHDARVLQQPHCLVYEGVIHYYADGPNYLDNVNQSSDSEPEEEIFEINSNQRLR